MSWTSTSFCLVGQAHFIYFVYTALANSLCGQWDFEMMAISFLFPNMQHYRDWLLAPSHYMYQSNAARIQDPTFFSMQ